MPNSKSLTSNDESYRRLIYSLAENADYRALLIELLAVIHRDGGQYTQLTGLAVSVEDAITRIHDMRLEIQNLFNARKKRG
jgi:hypothetical protein